MLKPGSKVRVKSLIDIEKTLDKYRCCRDVWFAPSMKKHCEKEFKIKEYISENNTFVFNDVSWKWCPEWFEVITNPQEDFLNDGSVEERSLCFALIRQTMSGNTPDLSIFTPHTNCSCKSYGGFNYQDFTQDEWYHTIAKNIPDWPCIKLKPKILEEAIENCLFQYGLEYFNEHVDDSLTCWFVFSLTGQGQKYWENITKVLDNWITAIEPSNTLNDKINLAKTENYENRFQKRKSTIIKGSVPKGSKICSRKYQTSITVGYLSYRKCVGR